MPDPTAVNSMFARIAGRYDRANRLLSGGIDLWWRRRLIKSVAAKKQPGMPQASDITFAQGDGLNLPGADASFDAATISFGLRNMADRHKCLSELHRVLRPGGYLWVLEFSQPKGWMRPFYYFYLRHILPHVAALVTGDKSAYDYLGGSIESFPTHQGISTEMETAGFAMDSVQRLTGGIVALHGGRKTESASAD
jgi:demethylmenaquinone methyltransferase/2-methoxy-6-polyprenyl-1,4-benzoquinol methylase